MIQTWTDTEAQWIALKPDNLEILFSLQSCLKQKFPNIVLTPEEKLHITLFRGINNSLNCNQQHEMMEQIARDCFEFSLNINIRESRLESRGPYVTWHFDNDNLRLLQEKVESIAKKFLEEHNFTFQIQKSFNPHITLGVFSSDKANQDCAIVDIHNENLRLLDGSFGDTTSICMREIYLIGVRGLKQNISDRTHHNLFTIILTKNIIEDFRRLINYAEEKNFNKYNCLRPTLNKKNFRKLVSDCLINKPEDDQRRIYKVLADYEEKIGHYMINKGVAKKLTIVYFLHAKKFRKMGADPICIYENRIKEGLDKRNCDVVRELLIEKQPRNIYLYNRYLALESDLTHIDTIFQLVKKIGIIDIETYTEYIRKLVKNKASIETIRNIFEEACSFFEGLDGGLVSSYMEAERTLENGNLEKIEEYYNRRKEMSNLNSSIYNSYFRFLHKQKRFEDAFYVCEESMHSNFNNFSMWIYHFEWKLRNYKNFSEVEDSFNFFNNKFKKRNAADARRKKVIYILFILEAKKIDINKAMKIYNLAKNNKIISCDLELLENELFENIELRNQLWLPFSANSH